VLANATQNAVTVKENSWPVLLPGGSENDREVSASATGPTRTSSGDYRSH
jgi:hypothetical protein